MQKSHHKKHSAPDSTKITSLLCEHNFSLRNEEENNESQQKTWAITENREIKKWKFSFFCQRRIVNIFAVTYRVTNFLPKLVDRKNWISISGFPLFSGYAKTCRAKRVQKHNGPSSSIAEQGIWIKDAMIKNVSSWVNEGFEGRKGQKKTELADNTLKKKTVNPVQSVLKNVEPPPGNKSLSVCVVERLERTRHNSAWCAFGFVLKEICSKCGDKTPQSSKKNVPRHIWVLHSKGPTFHNRQYKCIIEVNKELGTQQYEKYMGLRVNWTERSRASGTYFKHVYTFKAYLDKISPKG